MQSGAFTRFSTMDFSPQLKHPTCWKALDKTFPIFLSDQAWLSPYWHWSLIAGACVMIAACYCHTSIKVDVKAGLKILQLCNLGDCYLGWFSVLNIHVTLSLDKRFLSMSLAGISQRRPLSCQWHANSPMTLLTSDSKCNFRATNPALNCDLLCLKWAADSLDIPPELQQLGHSAILTQR